jgi:flagellar hook-basal body complex protein FliE
MEISTNSLYAQMQSMSLEASGNRLPGVQGAPPISLQGNEIGQVNSSSDNFGNLLKQAIDKVSDTQLEAGQLKNAFEMGDRNVTLAQTMVASAKAGVAFDGAVQVRNKFVEAYKEVMSMPV